MSRLFIGCVIGAAAMLAVQSIGAMSFYRSRAEAMTAAAENPDLFLRWVTVDGCTALYGPSDYLWGLKCPQFHIH